MSNTCTARGLARNMVAGCGSENACSISLQWQSIALAEANLTSCSPAFTLAKQCQDTCQETQANWRWPKIRDIGALNDLIVERCRSTNPTLHGGAPVLCENSPSKTAWLPDGSQKCVGQYATIIGRFGLCAADCIASATSCRSRCTRASFVSQLLALQRNGSF